MSSETELHGALEIRCLKAGDAETFAALVAEYSWEMRQSPTKLLPDVSKGIVLLEDTMAETVGAFLENQLVGFAIFFDLPEAISGGRAGQLDDLFVAPSFRGRRLARNLIDAVSEIGRERGWIHLRWLVPDDNKAARQAYERFAEAAPWKSYVLWLGDGEQW
ncbi:MAG: N-acetyltransferase [Rhizobiaceae bacterium MnEN-MB40S]|nr:MAG: N-acetyltransferase [Rhizobiaceae bacterium MnEN-MB40S]